MNFSLRARSWFEELLGAVERVRAELLDGDVLRRPGTLLERVPSHLPLPLLLPFRPALQLQPAPGKRRPGQAVDEPNDAAIGKPSFVDPQRNRHERRPEVEAIVARGFGHVHGKVVAGELLCRHHQPIQVRRQPALDQRQVANIPQVQRQAVAA